MRLQVFQSVNKCKLMRKHLFKIIAILEGEHTFKGKNIFSNTALIFFLFLMFHVLDVNRFTISITTFANKDL